MRLALLADDWNEVAEVMRAGYPNRKRLAPGVTTPQMEKLVEKALSNGAEAAKVCGAGGGGCIAFLCSEGRKQDVEKALSAEPGAEIINWKFSKEGLTVKVS
jgi:D-glycero-alpha-D-manno-heptose-7-phosphate kinase